MRMELIKQRLARIETRCFNKPFTIFSYKMPNGKTMLAKTQNERASLESKGGTLESFDIHIPDNNAEGGYNHVIW